MVHIANGNGKRVVSWQVFIWAVSIVTALIFGAYGLANSSYNQGVDNRVQIEGINRDYVNIKESLQRIEEKLDYQMKIK